MLLFSFLSLLSQEVVIKKCPKCQFLEKNRDAKYCIHCAEKLIDTRAMEVFICPKCNKALKKLDHYCPVCGEKKISYCAACGVKGVLVYQEIPEEKYDPSVPVSQMPDQEKIAPIKKPIPNLEQFAYPGDILLEKQVMDEGFLNTSRNRKIQKFLYKSQASVEQIEEHYRKLYPESSVIRFVDEILKTPGLILKYSPKEKEIMEIILYTFSDYPREDWTNIHKKIQNKIQEELKPLAQLEKELANLQKMIREGKTTVSKSQEQQEDIKRRMKSTTHSKGYWQLYAKEKVCSLGHNIVLIHVVSAK